MANSKVQLADGTVLIDLTGDTVSAASMLSGTTAHDKAGNAITGTFVPTGKPEQVKTASYTANGTYDITPDSGYAMSKATVTVAIPYYEGW